MLRLTTPTPPHTHTHVSNNNQLFRGDGNGRLTPRSKTTMCLQVDGDKEGSPLILWSHRYEPNSQSCALNQMVYLDEEGRLVVAHAPQYAIGANKDHIAAHATNALSLHHHHQQHSMDDVDTKAVLVHETTVYRNGERIEAHCDDEDVLKGKYGIQVAKDSDNDVESDWTMINDKGSAEADTNSRSSSGLDHQMENEATNDKFAETVVNQQKGTVNNNENVEDNLNSAAGGGGGVDDDDDDSKTEDRSSRGNGSLLLRHSAESEVHVGCGLALVPIDSPHVLHFEWRSPKKLEPSDLVADYWGDRDAIRSSIRTPSTGSTGSAKSSSKQAQQQQQQQQQQMQQSSSMSRLWAGTKNLFSVKIKNQIKNQTCFLLFQLRVLGFISFSFLLFLVFFFFLQALVNF
jgi:hypothetical protein